MPRKSKNSNLLYKSSKNVIELSPKDFHVKDLKKGMMPLKGEPVIVVYYAHWCPHCHSEEMTQLWDALGHSLKNKTNIKTAAFNADLNDSHRQIAQNIGIQGFPTIKFYNNNNVDEYMGPREPKDILMFLHNALKKHS